MMKSRNWECKSCAAYYYGSWWKPYRKELAVWKQRHKMFNDGLVRLEKLVADPEMRCPRCGGVSSIRRDVGIGCPGCSMRYSPVTPKSKRFRPIREDYLKGLSSKDCKI